MSSMKGASPRENTMRNPQSPIVSVRGAPQAAPAAAVRSPMARSMSGTAKHTW